MQSSSRIAPIVFVSFISSMFLISSVIVIYFLFFYTDKPKITGLGGSIENIKKLKEEASKPLSCNEAKMKYSSDNPDINDFKINPWVHYVEYGKNEGRVWPGEDCNLEPPTHHGNNGTVSGQEYCYGKWESADNKPKLLFCEYGQIDKSSDKYTKGDIVNCNRITNTPTSYRCYR